MDGVERGGSALEAGFERVDGRAGAEGRKSSEEGEDVGSHLGPVRGLKEHNVAVVTTPAATKSLYGLPIDPGWWFWM